MTANATEERIIYHIVPADDYDKMPPDQPYTPLRFAEEGFIHCAKGEERVLLVANTVYRKVPGKFLLLVIGERLVEPEIRYEIVGEILFPHIYGPLNRNAIIRVQEMARAKDGTFLTIAEPPSPIEALGVHPAAVAAEAGIEDVLLEMRRLRRVADKRIAAMEQEIESFRQGKPTPVTTQAPAPATAPASASKPSVDPMSKLEQQIIDLRSILVDRIDKLEARVATLEKKLAPRAKAAVSKAKAKTTRKKASK